jgi:hypothetical protein
VQTEAPDAVYGPFEPATPWRPADLEWFQRLVGTAREELPEQVLDLSDTFDDVDEPLMPDWAHTNRTGARLVASALADHVVRWARDGTL